MKTLNQSGILFLAASIKKQHPKVTLGESGLTDDGFYYDFSFTDTISNAQLAVIEKQINRYISGGYKLLKSNKLELENQEYKDIIQKENKDISFFDLINPANNYPEYTDFIVGALSSEMPRIKYIKLLSLSGAYWKGDHKNKQFTRIYGIVKNTKSEMEEYLRVLEERKQSDHRVIGKKMGIFRFDLLSGQGFPNWLEDGMLLKNSIQKYILYMDKKYGFKEVSTSIVGNKKLYEISGHLDHYSDTMFPIINLGGEELILRPMTCPHHILLYQSQPRTYKEFPIRYSEQSLLYRNEKSGGLTGLERVRSMELTEGHIFTRKDQIQKEIEHCYTLIKEVLERFKINIHSLVLSLRDPSDKEKYYDDDKMWNEAEEDLRHVLQSLNIKFTEEIGEAAFYGPKIDIQVLTAMKKEITLSTLQLDFLLPKKFDIKYLNKDKSLSRPILLHRGLVGTYERFIAILLEQNKGNLPFWLAPKQIEIIPINITDHEEYAQKIYDELNLLDFRVSINKTRDRLSKKIRDSQIKKNKIQIIIGDEEMKNNNLQVRELGKETSKLYSFYELTIKLNNENKI